MEKKFRVTGLLCGEFTGHRWIPRTKASDAEIQCFPWSAPQLTFPAFPAHAQPAILRIWEEAHGHTWLHSTPIYRRTSNLIHPSNFCSFRSISDVLLLFKNKLFRNKLSFAIKLFIQHSKYAWSCTCSYWMFLHFSTICQFSHGWHLLIKITPLVPGYYLCMSKNHDDVIKWKQFPRYWPFVRRIHRSPVNSSHKGQWSGALMFSLICVWINDWVNNGEAGDLRRYSIHYDVTVMFLICGRDTHHIQLGIRKQHGR